MSVEVRDMNRVERRILDAPSAPLSPWLYPNMKTHLPDDGNPVDPLPSIAPTAQLRRK